MARSRGRSWPPRVPGRELARDDRARVERMREALRILGWSAHTGMPRFGPKAQLARWALGADEWPADVPVRDQG
jgi:hypothetical protein